jgi:diguanylate cyclase (GGDEF)-like protein
MEQSKILIVDDRPENLLALELLFEEIPCEIFKALSGNEALGHLVNHDFAMVLLDVQMPDMDGFETAELMRGNKKTSHVPIIFVTAISKEQRHVFQGYKSGAVDYLFKPFEPEILLNKVSVFLELYRYRRGLEEAQEELLKQKRILEELSIKDDLTGLYNRRHLNTVLKQEFERSKRYNTDLSCLLLDLDHFKKINDTYGHGFGDTVLRRFAHRLTSLLRSSDFSFRFGGEEFLLLLPHTNIAGAKQVGETIRLSLATKKIEDTNHSAIVTVSIGVSSCHQHQPESQNDLIAFADKALYAAKENGRNQVVGG